MVIKKLFQKAKNGWEIILISIFSFLFKLSGLTWGFPATLHNDESNVIRSSLGMRFGSLNPHHFDWPSLYFYINYFVFWVFIKLRTHLQVIFGVEKMKETFPFWWGHELPFFLIGRIITNVFIVTTGLLTYKIGLQLFKNKKYALFGTIVFLSGSWVTYFSFYALSDSALMFFMLLSFFFSLKILTKQNLKNYLLAGLFAGFATSIKYNGAFICIAIPIAHLLREKRLSALLNKKIVLAGAISLFTFFVGTPYAILDWKTFSGTNDASGAFWQAKHIGIGSNLSHHLLQVLPENFGWLIVLIGAVGIYYGYKAKDVRFKLFSIVTTLYVFFIGFWGIARAQYAYPIFPFFSILTILGYSTLTKNREGILKKTGKLLLILMFLQPLTRNTFEIIKRNREDTRILAGRWITKNVPQGSYLQSDTELTWRFGGDFPVFDYGEYQISTPKNPKTLIKTTEKYIIVTNNNIPNEGKITYEFKNDFRTGPTISIYKLSKE